MVQLSQSTNPKSAKSITRKWHVIDAKGQVLGRIATEVSTLLIGKGKVDYVPYLDMGDYVVIINAKDVEVTGRKAMDKEYQLFSGYPGGLRRVPYERMLDKNPDYVIRHAISGMLPKNKLRDPRLARLFIFADENHPYQNKVS
jgi:large subunit ribosomal protein L13